MFIPSCTGCKFLQAMEHCGHDEAQTRHPDDSIELKTTAAMRKDSFIPILRGPCGRDAKLRELR